MNRLVIAYEPVWAISSGANFSSHQAATPEIASDAANFIRHQIRELYGPKAARHVRVLYGGSTSASNARSFLDAEGIDGLLVGGASLNYAEFTSINRSGVSFSSRDR